ncbi:hypothetical protein MAH1_34420 [Sessilibacter sp. MAH1]
MLKNIVKFGAVLFSCVFLSSYSLAAANQNTGNVKITRMINVGNTGQNVLEIITDQSQVTNPAGCANPNRYVLPADFSEIGRAMILGARVAEKEIQFVIWGGGCFGSQNYPQIVHVIF